MEYFFLSLSAEILFLILLHSTRHILSYNYYESVEFTVSKKEESSVREKNQVTCKLFVLLSFYFSIMKILLNSFFNSFLKI